MHVSEMLAAADEAAQCAWLRADGTPPAIEVWRHELGLEIRLLDLGALVVTNAGLVPRDLYDALAGPVATAKPWALLPRRLQAALTVFRATVLALEPLRLVWWAVDAPSPAVPRYDREGRRRVPQTSGNVVTLPSRDIVAEMEARFDDDGRPRRKGTRR